ncbi:MAG: hypothetical protein HUJ42_00335 [Malacoplasma sp.]|nr:hypothetical protein [Malacoplasma sp.]
MYSNQSSFNVKNLTASFNKTANINKIFEKIHHRYSLREVTVYAFVGYYKNKKNTILFCFSNQKIFIDDEKNKIWFCGAYTYKDIKSLTFVPNQKAPQKSYLEIETDNHKTFKIKGVSHDEFKIIINVFKKQKEIYFKSFLGKVTNQENGFELIDETYTYSTLINSISSIPSKSEYEQELKDKEEKEIKALNSSKTQLIEGYDIDNEEDIDNHEIEMDEKEELQKLNFNSSARSINTSVYESLKNEKELSTNDLISHSNLLVESLESPKNKKVVNDTLATSNNTFSSVFISNLLTNQEFDLPGGKKTLFYFIDKRIKELESNNLAIKGIDSTPVRLDKKILKLNTVPVIIETKPLNSSSINDDENENHLFFSRNWIEYTKHNVTNKLLGVDEKGNGAYIDFNKANSSKTIDIFKAKEYKLNDEIRNGLRSSQTISFLERNGKPGINSFYTNLKNGEKLNVNQYDGIIFQGIKYYFGSYDEFSKLQKKYLRIFFEDKKINGEIFRKYELIFDDDLITYKAYNERSELINDSFKNSNSYDLKWLTFFKE